MGKSEEAEEQRRKLRANVYVNCWHLNERESGAMWTLYGQQSGSVAIRSTFKRLVDVLPEWIQTSLVDYVDYHDPNISKDHRTGLKQFVLKHRSYEHEHELRAIACNRPGSGFPSDAIMRGVGLRMPVPLDHLLECVFVSPKAPVWFCDVVSGLLQKYFCMVGVSPSEFDIDPIY